MRMNLIRLELPDGITNSIDGYSVVRALNDCLLMTVAGARKVSSITLPGNHSKNTSTGAR